MARKPRKSSSPAVKKSLSTPKTRKGKAAIEECVQLVEQFLVSVGLNPDQQRLTELDTLGWMAEVGSAVVFIYINEYKDLATLRVFSPMFYLPLNNILPFYRRLLEKNFRLISCAFAVNEDKVGLIAERSIEGLSAEEVAETVSAVAMTADDMDEELAEEFGARMFTVEES